MFAKRASNNQPVRTSNQQFEEEAWVIISPNPLPGNSFSAGIPKHLQAPTGHPEHEDSVHGLDVHKKTKKLWMVLSYYCLEGSCVIYYLK